ncbi:hypothetical protein ACJ5NV_04285 [Loktanella agnita]|uniref:hypothetical protein n=1 Tax=Loktanella agnita TaxID=287097 RepID=UPI0039869370
MWARFKKTTHLTRGEKLLALAFGAVIAMSAGMTILIMSGFEHENPRPPEPSLYDHWIVLSGAFSGGFTLYLARGWMGMQGTLGIARALVGSIILAFVAAVMTGTLIMPIYGTLFGPIMLVTQFIELPALAVLWFVIAVVVHALIAIWREERALGYGRGADRGALSQLSRMSQINLHRYNSGR